MRRSHKRGKEKDDLRRTCLTCKYFISRKRAEKELPFSLKVWDKIVAPLGVKAVGYCTIRSTVLVDTIPCALYRERNEVVSDG